MDALVLVNSRSPAFREARELVLPMLSHLGVPGHILDLARSPLPPRLSVYALVIAAHSRLGAGRPLREAVLRSVHRGAGLVSFDPRFPLSGETSPRRKGGRPGIELAGRHWITSDRSARETAPLAGPFRCPPLPVERGETLIRLDGRPLLAARDFGNGRMARWASAGWLRPSILGPLGGLDGAFWKCLAWAARKPFAFRGLPPLVSMRVDDVAGQGGLFGRSPLYWAETAARHGFKPWLGLFIYNLSPRIHRQVRELVSSGRATAFPHAFGRPPWMKPGLDFWYPHGIPTSDSGHDEFIYYDHDSGRPWPEAEEKRRLRAVRDWYAAHPSLPISPLAIPHYYEMGINAADFVSRRWGAEFTSLPKIPESPMVDGTPWLRGGPFRRYGKPGTAAFDPALLGTRPAYYADFIRIGGRRLFNCLTEIRDVAGYEWSPDNDVAASAERGLRILNRALDSMAPAVLLTHETDHIWKIRPNNWEKTLRRLTCGLRKRPFRMATLEEAARFVRATRTSRLASCRYEPGRREVTARLAGRADTATTFCLFTGAGGSVHMELVEIPPFRNGALIRRFLPRAS